MGKIDLTYINKQIAAKKAAEVKTTEKKAAEVKTTEKKAEAQVEEKEIFGETYTEFKERLDREMEETMKSIKAMKELGI